MAEPRGRSCTARSEKRQLHDARRILEQLGQLSDESFVAPQEAEWTKYLHPQIGQVHKKLGRFPTDRSGYGRIAINVQSGSR